ncbi:MAG: prepilin-type N-terminal cleavage/methylation domain-containing protein [Gemmatimonadota bacterium]|nr:prepilin-type N-terminal cleavage/methylation domain-containing protein [Gemmatimonadota bacterium]MDQ8147281.1 prepilin-type N-terminal cleavage/methylation domain-containing protein [Gemmatimonadota bacterium]MDQ8156299.1 prepilin-type N-terminal cleavage/methylation domain-containing protein [Gemmatimonadota bacterium]
MPVSRSRPGMSLVELLVASAIASLLSLAAVALLRHVGRAAAVGAANARAEAVAQEALAVAGALIEAAVVIAVLGDTAVDLVSLVTDVIPCRDGTAAPIRTDVLAPAPGDRWVVLVRTVTTEGRDSLVWRAAEPMRVVPDGLGCVATDTARLLLRVTAQTRLVPYRSSDGSWMLGVRRCAERCEPAQPVAGPIRAPSDGGFQVRQVVCGLELGVRPAGATAVRWRLAGRC